MARLNNKMTPSKRNPKNYKIANIWGGKTFTEKAREDSNLKIGGKIPSAANKAKELEEFEKRIRGY